MDIHKKIFNVNKFLITGRVTFCVTVINNRNFLALLILHDTQLDLNLIHLIWPSMLMYLSRLFKKKIN